MSVPFAAKAVFAIPLLGICAFYTSVLMNHNTINEGDAARKRLLATPDLPDRERVMLENLPQINISEQFIWQSWLILILCVVLLCNTSRIYNFAAQIT